jgi:hypothetical protein
MQLVQDDMQIQIVPIATFLLFWGVIWISYSLLKWKFLKLLNDHIDPPPNYVDCRMQYDLYILGMYSNLILTIFFLFVYFWIHPQLYIPYIQLSCESVHRIDIFTWTRSNDPTLEPNYLNP